MARWSFVTPDFRALTTFSECTPFDAPTAEQSMEQTERTFTKGAARVAKVEGRGFRFHDRAFRGRCESAFKRMITWRRHPLPPVCTRIHLRPRLRRMAFRIACRSSVAAVSHGAFGEVPTNLSASDLILEDSSRGGRV